jgi:hypothetical protein
MSAVITFTLRLLTTHHDCCDVTHSRIQVPLDRSLPISDDRLCFIDVYLRLSQSRPFFHDRLVDSPQRRCRIAKNRKNGAAQLQAHIFVST